MSEKTMMLVEATWQDKKTFRLIPVAESCPYVECIFDPGTKVFVVILKITKTALHMLPKLDEYGQPIAGNKGQREERHKLDVFQEFYIEDKIAVKDLIHLFAINAKTFDYGAFMSEKEEELPVAGV